MSNSVIISETQLDDWVAKNDREAQSFIVELVNKLVSVSCPQASYRHFPLRINQQGPDGELITEFEFKNFVPKGRSFWEIGTGSKARDKATSDYEDLTTSIPEKIRLESSFIFVTPRSGASDWSNTWKMDGIASWIETRRDSKEWQDVRVINGAILTDWVSYFPGIGHWLAGKVLGFPRDFETAQSRWDIISSFGEPPRLTHDLYTISREEASPTDCGETEFIASARFEILKVHG